MLSPEFALVNFLLVVSYERRHTFFPNIKRKASSRIVLFTSRATVGVSVVSLQTSSDVGSPDGLLPLPSYWVGKGAMSTSTQR